MATLEAPFTAKQLKSAIGASGNNVNNYFTGSDGYINPYSTFKPVRSNSDESDEYLMQDCNFGFNTSYISSTNINTIFNNAKSYGTWEDLYQHPTSSYLYRWEDFNGYDDYADEPFSYDVQTNVSGTTIEQVIIKNSNSIDVTSMGIVNDYSGWEWAIAHRKSDTTSVSYSYGGEVSSWDDEIVITQEFEESGTYECVFIMTNGSMHIWMSGGYFSVKVTIDTTPKVLAGVNEARWYGSTSIRFVAFIENYGSSVAYINSPVVIKLRFVEKDYDDDMVAGEYAYNWSISSIAAGDTQEFDQSQFGLGNYSHKYYKVCMKVRLTNGEEIYVEEELERELS
jgi:hypothetical protein